MLLTITASASEALPDSRDLGFLLHKNPSARFERALSFGIAHVFYPEASAEKTTAALFVEIDPIGLVRGKSTTLAEYVSDRPYAASSFLSVAVGQCFASALGARSKEKPELVTTSLSLSATIHAVDCDAGPDFVSSLFTPLGWAVTVDALPLDPMFPEWGGGHLMDVTLVGDSTLHDLLSHLYVLIPVLDNAKHYEIGDDEVEKLLRHGDGWLATHPAREKITTRYLRYRRPLTSAALERLKEEEAALTRLAESEETPVETEARVSARDEVERSLERPARLNDRRIDAALDAVLSAPFPARKIVDLGCGEGRTLRDLVRKFPDAELVAGVDVSTIALKIASRRLKLDSLAEHRREKIALWHGSLVYRDDRLRGFDVALLCEVIEHLDADRLASLEDVVFAHAAPRRIAVTTPNAEYNVTWQSLPAGKFRHPDHRFEWTRAEFQAWANAVAERHGYAVAFSGIGDDSPDGHGTPTQMAIFDRKQAS